MSPLVRCLPTYVKDTNHALHIFDSFRFDNSDLEQYLLFIMDVKSLYTVIPNNCGLQALTYFLETRNVKEPSSLIRLAKLVLTLNAFSFNNVHHCQIGHVVMGGKMGPNYACLFIGYIEHQILNSTQALFGNYAGDILMILLEHLRVGERNWKPLLTSWQTSTRHFNSLPLSLR